MEKLDGARPHGDRLVVLVTLSSNISNADMDIDDIVDITKSCKMQHKRRELVFLQKRITNLCGQFFHKKLLS
jgi:hypothetical protein